MSDSDDRKSPSGGRGPLPRRTRSRGGRARRRVTPTGDRESSVAESVDSVPRPTEPDAPYSEAKPEPVEPARDAEERSSGVETIATDAGSDTADIASRPTQLDAGNRRNAKTDLDRQLKRVTVARAPDAPDSTEQAGATAAYVGYVIDGRYRLESVIGRGGMGVVYQAKHQVIDKMLAVKILLPTENHEVVERFVNEARAATAIGNAHIVDTLDFGELPDGSTYFVMEYLNGETLSNRIKREKFIPTAEALSVVKQVAEAMHAAHDAKIIHRDLKPENIYIVPSEKEPIFVKLLDFGIAKIANAQNKLTRAGMIFGTPHYMSPEQAAGHEVDHRTDIYALGVTLYEMVSGQVPFEAENPMGLLTQHMYSPPPPLTKIENPPQPISVSLDAVVLKCLAKKADDRYASMAELAHDIERVANGAVPTAISYLIARSEDPELVAAARSERARARGGSGWRAALALAILAIGGGYVALRAFDRKMPEHAFPEASTTGATRVEAIIATASAPPPSHRMVALVLSPIDAEVFRGSDNLGSMPVNVAVPQGQTVRVVIKRDGFYPEKLELDGSERRVVVQLSAIPGAKPAVPVPDDEAIERWKREHAQYNVGAAVNRSRDAGLPRAADAGSLSKLGWAPLEGPVPRSQPRSRDAGTLGLRRSPRTPGIERKARPPTSGAPKGPGGPPDDTP